MPQREDVERVLDVYKEAYEDFPDQFYGFF